MSVNSFLNIYKLSFNLVNNYECFAIILFLFNLTFVVDSDTISM